MTSRMFCVVAAIDGSGGFSKGGRLPWRFPKELAWFAKLTKGHTVIMGRKTWESLPPAHRPLTDRTNIVLTSQVDYPLPPTVLRAPSLDDALTLTPPSTTPFLIGGVRAIDEALRRKVVNHVFLTSIEGRFSTDLKASCLLGLLQDTGRHPTTLQSEMMVNRNDGQAYRVSQLQFDL